MTDLARRQRIERDSHAHEPGTFLRRHVATGERAAVRRHGSQPSRAIALEIQRSGDCRERGDPAISPAVESSDRRANRHHSQFCRPAAPGNRRRTQRARVRAELGLDDSWILLGTIGSVIPRKGILYLVRALPQVLAAAPRTRLAIINEGGFKGYTAKVRATIRRLGLENHVLWLGPGNHVPRLLPALDLYVLPSLEESLPMAVLEAMATGLPVVATSVGGVPECILPGETGVLVPPADCAALGGAVVRLLKDPAERRTARKCGTM